MFKDIFKLTGLNAISRITGFFREVAFARVFGTSIYADAFLVAFRIPNLFRSVFAEGAASNALLPVMKKAEQAGLLKKYVTFALFFLICCSCLIAFSMCVFPKTWISLIAPGLSIETYYLASSGLCFVSWYLVCMTVVLVLNNVLSYYKKFGFAAFVQIALNLCFALYLIYGRQEPYETFQGLVTVTFVLSVVFIIISLLLLRKFFSPFKFDQIKSLCKEFIGFFAIGLLISTFYQLLVFVSTITASFFEQGSIATLNYADRLYQIPYGIIGVSLAHVSLSYFVVGKMKENLAILKKAFYLASRLGFFFAGLLIGVSDLLVSIVYGSWALSQENVASIAKTLRCLLYGLPFGITGLVISRYLYAEGKHKINLLALAFQLCVFVILIVSTFLLESNSISLKTWFTELDKDIQFLALALSISTVFYFLFLGFASMGLSAFLGNLFDMIWPLLASLIGIFSIISVDLSDFSAFGRLIIYSVIYAVSFGAIFFVEVIGRKF
ncbi:MAG: hypothetical protein NZT61_00145 [Deltaproteobacteria bacterium]|nr:hypothetical protein [Deltaproteobacteria bacterium]MCX7952440.1 hypothetical protein [Deltaproteobacteria bacterium]